MTMFRIILIAMIAIVGIYTLTLGFSDGWNLVPVFFGDMFAHTWPGQFNLDFSCFLVLSGLWVGWRHHFSGRGLLLMPVFMFLGIMILAPYLLYLSFKTDGNVAEMLLGPQRANA